MDATPTYGTKPNWASFTGSEVQISTDDSNDAGSYDLAFEATESVHGKRAYEEWQAVLYTYEPAAVGPFYYVLGDSGFTAASAVSFTLNPPATFA